jgi:hypothetical protein
MEIREDLSKVSGARMVATLFGVLAGLGGLTHGIGEMLQGNVTPDGLIINSWTQGPIAAYMGGEPGMTIVPNLFLTGLLTTLVSLATIVWSAVFMQRKNGGRVLIGLSVLMLLFGGGFGPPVIGILAGAAGTGIRSSSAGLRARLFGGNGRFAAIVWPWLFALAAASGIFLVIGSVILVTLFSLDNDQLFLNTFYLTVVSLFLTVVMTPAYDSQHSGRAIPI